MRRQLSVPLPKAQCGFALYNGYFEISLLGCGPCACQTVYRGWTNVSSTLLYTASCSSVLSGIWSARGHLFPSAAAWTLPLSSIVTSPQLSCKKLFPTLGGQLSSHPALPRTLNFPVFKGGTGTKLSVCLPAACWSLKAGPHLSHRAFLESANG